MEPAKIDEPQLPEGMKPAVTCVNHGTVELTATNYIAQLEAADDGWKCPVCGEDADFNDESVEPDDCDAGYACEDFGELEFQVRETLIWRGDIIPTSEAEVELAEQGRAERLATQVMDGVAVPCEKHGPTRERVAAALKIIANRSERYEDRDRCHAARSDGECSWSECPQLRDGEPGKTGRHCPLDTWSDEDE